MEHLVLLQIQIDTKNSNGNKTMITIDENIKKERFVERIECNYDLSQLWKHNLKNKVLQECPRTALNSSENRIAEIELVNCSSYRLTSN